MGNSSDKLVWLDLEMTGLEPETNTILEIGTIITDSHLSVLAEGPVIAIHQPESVLVAMDPWCIIQHGQSGLTQRCRDSLISLKEAEERTLRFLEKYCAPKDSPLCGNSIGQDRRFLAKYMPGLNNFFHYRNIDVSSIKELVHRWYPATHHSPEKKKTHHVLEDIRESIEELRHYRKTVFR
jgi:oligoribonuclease